MASVRENLTSTARRDERLSIFPKYVLEKIPFDVRKRVFNVAFFILTLYFIIYMMISMWPVLIAFLVVYFHNTGLPFTYLVLMDILIKVGLFVIDLTFNIMVGIMRFVMTF